MKYILTNCNIINGISDSLIKGKSVVVKDDIFEDITENILPYKDYKIIDLKNKYLMPDLINLHVHLPGSGNPNGGKTKIRKLLIF